MPGAADVVALALSRGARIACAESCTGGMVSAALTDVAGSSAIFDAGYVTYANAAKVAMLGVLPATLDRYGAVSEQTAAEMAQGAQTRAGVTIAVSTTGIAGPGGSEHKPEGRVCFGLAGPGGVATQTVEFGARGRAQVRQAATAHALRVLANALRALPEKQA